jgi:hypothetical protein
MVLGTNSINITVYLEELGKAMKNLNQRASMLRYELRHMSQEC